MVFLFFQRLRSYNPWCHFILGDRLTCWQFRLNAPFIDCHHDCVQARNLRRGVSLASPTAYWTLGNLMLPRSACPRAEHLISDWFQPGLQLSLWFAGNARSCRVRNLRTYPLFELDHFLSAYVCDVLQCFKVSASGGLRLVHHRFDSIDYDTKLLPR